MSNLEYTWNLQNNPIKSKISLEETFDAFIVLIIYYKAVLIKEYCEKKTFRTYFIYAISILSNKKSHVYLII